MSSGARLAVGDPSHSYHTTYSSVAQKEWPRGCIKRLLGEIRKSAWLYRNISRGGLYPAFRNNRQGVYIENSRRESGIRCMYEKTSGKWVPGHFSEPHYCRPRKEGGIMVSPAQQGSPAACKQCSTTPTSRVGATPLKNHRLFGIEFISPTLLGSPSAFERIIVRQGLFCRHFLELDIDPFGN